jgi:hypothetical protein
MDIDQKIRLVTIWDTDGKMMYSDYPEGIENLLTVGESKKSLKLAVNAWSPKQPCAKDWKREI